MIDKRCVFVDLEYDNAETLLEYMGGKLYELGYVRDSFPKAVADREKEYPTGLATEQVKVAIPHTDAAHVIQETVAVAILKKPVSFLSIEQDGEELQVQIVFMLALSKAGSHLELLRAVMRLIQDSFFLQQLLAEKDPAQIAALMSERLAQG